MNPKLAFLVESVAVMRELGVTEWDGIRLGPVPVVHVKRPDPPTPEEAAKRKAADDKRALFAASGFMPKDES